MNRLIGTFCLLLLCVSLKSQSYAALVDSSFISLERKDTIACVHQLKQALRKEPANPMNSLLLNNLGSLQRAKGEYQEALISFSAALGFAPNTWRILVNRGKTYCDIDNVSLALADFEKVLSQEENHEEALYYTSILYLSRGDTLRSEQNFKKILSGDPDSELGLSASAAWSKSMENFVEAETIYNRLIALHPAKKDYLLNRAEVLYRQKKQSKAISDLDKYLLSYPNDGEAHLLKALVQLELFEGSAARVSLEKAQKSGIDPQIIQPLLKRCN